MNQTTNPDDPRRHDLLAGYADGELGPADRATVEAWIAADAAAAAELDLQQRFARNAELWSKVAAPVPSDEAWDRVFVGIQERSRPAAPAPSYRTGGRMSSARLSKAAAIAVGLLIAVGAWYLSQPNGIDNSVMSADEAWQVVHADDITIMSLQGDDGMLVVGRSPLTGPIDLVTVGDTELWATSTDVSETPSKPIVSPGDPKRPIWWNPADKITPVP